MREITEAETLAALKMWGEWRSSGAGRVDVAFSARAGAAQRWAIRVERALLLMEPALRTVLAQTYVEGLSIKAARQDVRTQWTASEYREKRRQAVATMRKLLGRLLFNRP